MFSRLRRIIAKLKKRDELSDKERKRFVKTLEHFGEMFPEAKTIGELKNEIIKYSREVQRIAGEKEKEKEKRRVGYIA